jgi:hypothetical protein
MGESWRAILKQLRDARFSEIDGAEAAVVLPLSEHLVTRLVRQAVPAVHQLREFEVRATPGNLLTLWVRLSQPAFLPGFRVRLHIESQPQLPTSPVLRLRVVSRGLAAWAGPIASLLVSLPPGIALDGDRLSVNLSTLLERYGAAETLSYLTAAELTTGDGRLIVTLRAAIPRADETGN